MNLCTEFAYTHTHTLVTDKGWTNSYIWTHRYTHTHTHTITFKKNPDYTL